jgi:hypothetical protein
LVTRIRDPGTVGNEVLSIRGNRDEGYSSGHREAVIDLKDSYPIALITNISIPIDKRIPRTNSRSSIGEIRR